MIDTGNERRRIVTVGGSVLAPRTNSAAAVLELASRLAEEFDTVPLPMVSRAVKSAAEAVRLFGEDVASALPTIERIAREDLQALRESAAADVPA